MAKSLAEIAADWAAMMGGRKLDLRDYNFDDLTVLQPGTQPATAELSLDELRALIAEHRAQGTSQEIGDRTWHG